MVEQYVCCWVDEAAISVNGEEKDREAHCSVSGGGKWRDRRLIGELTICGYMHEL